MTKESTKKLIFICIIGYALVIILALMLTLIVKIFTGYFPSFTFFTLALITFRLSEVSYTFLIAPLFVATIMMMLFSRTSINIRITSGISLSSYYAFIMLIFIAMGSGDFPYLVLIPWVVFVYFLGFISPIIIERIK